MYRTWAIRLFQRMHAVESVDIAVSYHPLKEFATPDWLGTVDTYFKQQGDSLSDYIIQSFQYGFDKKYKSVVVIGTDSPDLPYEYVSNAFHELRLVDVVLGPSVDGGYYLVGLNALFPELFQNISFSTSDVFSQTVTAIKDTKLSFHCLPLHFDVDTVSDLDLLDTSTEI